MLLSWVWQVKARLVELGAVVAVVTQSNLGDRELKRAMGYFLALIAEQAEFHEVRQSGTEING